MSASAKSQLPDLYLYGDFRSYLKDCYEMRKRLRRGWSYGAWARQVGVRSPSTLVMIVKGTRNPSPQLVRSLAKSLSLDPARASYFEDLIQLEKSKLDIRAAAAILERLEKRNTRGTFRFIDPDAFAALSRWYFHAIREMVNLNGFQDDPHWIASHLSYPVGPKQVRDALRTLIDKEMLVRDERGKLGPGPGTVEVSSEVANEAIRSFHDQALANAQASLRQHPTQHREFRGTTFAMPREKMPQARELIRDFHNSLCDLLESSKADSVYHLEVALFPVAGLREGADA